MVSYIPLTKIEYNEKWKSPSSQGMVLQFIDLDKGVHHKYATSSQIYSDRHQYNSSVRRQHTKPLDESQMDTHRDISPYRIENFIEMLHNFGVSDSQIKNKIMKYVFR